MVLFHFTADGSAVCPFFPVVNPLLLSLLGSVYKNGMVTRQFYEDASECVRISQIIILSWIVQSSTRWHVTTMEKGLFIQCLNYVTTAS